MWFTHGPGGLPIPLAIGRQPPPPGQTVIDGLSFTDALDAGVLTPDNTYGQKAVTSAWRWFRSLGF